MHICILHRQRHISGRPILIIRPKTYCYFTKIDAKTIIFDWHRIEMLLQQQQSQSTQTMAADIQESQRK